MRILAISTVTEMCSVALSVEDHVFERHQLAPNQHSDLVLNMVESVLKEANVSLASLDLIVSDVGPGSFTGIRIGIGVTQGLAYGSGLSVLGVDSLSTLAMGVKSEDGQAIIAAIDARMGQVYWGQFIRKNGELLASGKLQLSEPADIFSDQKSVVCVGSGFQVYADQIDSKLKCETLNNDQFPMAIDSLKLALYSPESSWVHPSLLYPVYLRNDVAKVKSLVNQEQ